MADAIEQAKQMCEKTLKIEAQVEEVEQMNSGMLAVNLSKSMNQYKTLKRQFYMLQTKLLLYESLETGEMLDRKQVEEELKQAVEEVEMCKTDIETSKTNIKDLADQLQNLLSTYKEEVRELRQVLETVIDKKMQLESRLHQTETPVSMDTTLAAQTAVLQHITEEVQAMSELEATWRQKLESVRREQADLLEMERGMAQLQRDLEQRVAQLVQNNMQLWKIEVTERLRLLQGIKDIHFKNNVLCVSLKGRDVVLQLKIHFEKDKEGYHILKSVEASPPSVDIEDIVETAVKENDVRLLVSLVASRWQYHHSLISEVEALRHRFALDWKPKESIVQVLYGKTVCSLKVETSYPRRGSMTLLSGGDHIQVPAEVTSLTEWLEFLQSQFLPGVTPSQI